MRKIILSMVMVGIIASFVFAADKFKDKDNIEWTKPEKTKDYKTYIKKQFSTELNTSGYYKEIVKPDITKDKILTDEESKQVKLSLWNEGLVDDKNKVIKEGRKLIFIQAKPAKNDYKHDYDRGTIYFTAELRKDNTPLLRNYSYHKVIIPDGTTIKECNFSQRKPDTEAIQGKNLIFIECNLVNVKIDSTWTIQNCNTAQIKKEIKTQEDLRDGTTKLVISHKVKDKDGKFNEVAEDEENISNSELANRLLYFAP